MKRILFFYYTDNSDIYIYPEKLIAAIKASNHLRQKKEKGDRENDNLSLSLCSLSFCKKEMCIFVLKNGVK